MTHITKVTDSDGTLLAEKRDGVEVVNNHGTGTDSPLVAGAVVSQEMTSNSGALVAPSVVSEENSFDDRPLMSQPVVSSNPQYGNGVDEEPLSMPSVVS